MKEIAEKTFIETDCLGVTLGAVLEPEQLTYIDAPLLPEKLRSWRNSLVGKKRPEQLVIISDSHPDRTIGSRYMESPIVAQEQVFRIYQNRPITFHAEEEKTGSDWEKIRNMAGFRWIIPEIIFSQSMDLKLHQRTITVEYHPGPSTGCSWTVLKDVNCVFVGDTVLTDHVPFLGDSDLNRWIESLDMLAGPRFEDYQIVSGRSGLVSKEDIQTMKNFILRMRELTESTDLKTGRPVNAIIAESSFEKYFKISKKIRPDAVERLTYGIKHLLMKQNSI